MPARTLTTFMDLPYVAPGDTDADVVIQGVAFDLATTARAGTRFGPDAIRMASGMLQWEPRRWPWDFALGERLRAADCGNVDFVVGQTPSMLAAVEAQTRALLRAGRRVVTLGGDHYVTLPLLRAHHGERGPLALLHFDAHTDTDEYSHDHHGVMFRHAAEQGLVDLAHSVQVGIRTYYEVSTHRYTVLDADWVSSAGAAAAAQRIRTVVGERPVYLSFDIDCLDPAYAPGTGTPVAGGLSSNLALQLVRSLRGLMIAGADVVEVSPPYDPGGITALAGATLALDILYLMASRR